MWPPEALPQAILVDLDGTIADSHGPLRGCFDRFLAARGVVATDNDFLAVDGIPLPQIAAVLQDRLGIGGEPAALAREYEHLVEAAYAAVRTAPGALELARSAAERDIRLVLVTSAPRRLAEAFLRGSGLADAFHAVVAGEDGRPKPDPSLFVRGLEEAGVDAADALAVDDAPAGVLGARAAGVAVVGIASDRKRAAMLREAGAGSILADLAELAAVLDAVPGKRL